jgi:YcaO-like protein with predicted kinase domain
VVPRESLTRLSRLTSQVGITRVGVVTGLDTIGIPVVMVCRPNSRSLSVAQGKGVDLVSAKVSGLGESLEGFHAENILLPLRLASWREIRRIARVVSVAELARRESSLFHEDLSILWVQGTDLISSERVWAPFETVHTDFRVPGPQGTGSFLSTTNGLATGNHLLEALSHALCEVIERDALTLWSLTGNEARASRRVDAATVDDPVCRELLDRFESADVGVEIFDITSDVGLAVFTCAIVGRHADAHRRLPAASGHGCHPSRAVALSRALTEAAQSRLTMIAGSRDDVLPRYYHEHRDRDQLERLRREFAGGRSRRSFLDVPDLAASSFEEDVATELDRLRSVGISEVLFFDLTRPDLGLPVVRVVVPGLEGFGGTIPDYRIGHRGLAFAAATS